ncbi:transposase [Spiroplasma ixodetis]
MTKHYHISNGISSKKLITQQGKIEINVPRDRNSNFEPVIVAKRQRRFDGFDQQVLSLDIFRK